MCDKHVVSVAGERDMDGEQSFLILQSLVAATPALLSTG